MYDSFKIIADNSSEQGEYKAKEDRATTTHTHTHMNCNQSHFNKRRETNEKKNCEKRKIHTYSRFNGIFNALTGHENLSEPVVCVCVCQTFCV